MLFAKTAGRNCIKDAHFARNAVPPYQTEEYVKNADINLNAPENSALNAVQGGKKVKNNKLLGILLWLIGFAVECTLLFCIAREYTASVWVTFGFTAFVFISQLGIWLYSWRNPLSAGERFLHTPLFTLSVWYMVLQAVPCLVFGIWQCPTKIAVLVNTALSIVIWVMMILSMLAKNNIEKVESRQKDHHISL